MGDRDPQTLFDHATYCWTRENNILTRFTGRVIHSLPFQVLKINGFSGETPYLGTLAYARRMNSSLGII